ncbi:MAG: uroporphyrinogen-III decarboxylase-like protein, partial [Ignavibacteria bacterium]|nr:uroporphyrinogen-III decarboxylase-like protein [Ignavibacteria bacterium]
LVSINPPRIRDHHPDDPEADIWGIRKKVVDYGSGTYDEFGNHPLAGARTVEDIDSFAWPRADNHDFAAYHAMIRKAPHHRIIRSGEFEPFLIYCAMRGMEQAMMDLLVEPDIAMAALNHIFDYYYELNQRTYEIGNGLIDVTYIAEDLGSQTQLLLSVPLIRKFILPNQKRMADLARSYGIHIFYHTDGAARDILPDLIDVTGIELLNPIQWRCPGMEREGLVRDYRTQIIFHGAMDNQQTLPFGTPDDVRAEVLENIDIFSGARWICAPCHNLQPVTPTGNIVTMYETIHHHGASS